MLKLTVQCSLFLLLYAASAGSGHAIEQVKVFVSITPQKYFVQQIGKDLTDVQVMVQPGADPHTYEPKPRQMVSVSTAKLYFAIGVNFEKVHLKKIVSTSPQLKVVHTDRGIQKLPMVSHHHHLEEGEHRKDGGLDPHIWLSPPLVKVQAVSILTTLQEIDPSHRAVYERNYNRFISRIDALDTKLQKTFAGKKGLQFMVYHPAWGYFAHTYGLDQVPVEIEGKAPKPAQLKELIEHARENGIKVVFVQPQFSTKSAELVAREIGGQVAPVDPLAEDWFANIDAVADKFREALR